MIKRPSTVAAQVENLLRGKVIHADGGPLTTACGVPYGKLNRGHVWSVRSLLTPDDATCPACWDPR